MHINPSSKKLLKRMSKLMLGQKARNKTLYNMTAVIRDRKKNILSVGNNSYTKTHPVMALLEKHYSTNHKKIRRFIHAEVDAILKCKLTDKMYSIEVYGVTFNGNLVCSKPCELCRGFIKTTKLKKVTYHNKDGSYITIDVKDL